MPLDPTPNDKAQTNSTDPEAKIMKRNNKGFDYCYNAQAVVDSAHQIIVAAEMTAAAGEGRGAQLGGGRNRVAARCARPTPTAPPQHGRQKHHAPEAPLPKPSAETGERPKASMSRKLRTDTGRRLYAARKHIVEPVFCQIKRVRGFRKFLLRGLELVWAEWQLVCLAHNLLKIWLLKIGR